MRWWEELGARESKRPPPRRAAGLPPAADTAAHRNAMNLLTATPAEVALRIAIALTDPRDLLHLALAVPPRFADKCIAAPPPPRNTSSTAAAATPAQQAEMWSIVEEAARRRIAVCTDQEQGWVPRHGRESWLGLMWEVEVLRRGAVFGRSHAGITLRAGRWRRRARMVSATVPQQSRR